MELLHSTKLVNFVMSLNSQEDKSSSISYLTSFFCHVIVAECKVGQSFNIIELTRCQNLVNLILNFLFVTQLLPSAKLVNSLLSLNCQEDKIRSISF